MGESSQSSSRAQAGQTSTMGNKGGKCVLTDSIVENISTTSGLGTAKVNMLCQEFLEKSPSGYIKKKEFSTIMKTVLPNVNLKKMEKNTFRMFDADQDGQISMEEFLILYQILSGGSPEENLKRIFLMFDADCDGTVSKGELRKIVKDMSKFIAQNSEESYADDIITENAWAEMDKNKDGKVTQQEFIDAVMAKDKFSKFLTSNVVDLFT